MKRKKRKQANAPQVMIKKKCNEQELEEDQLDGVHGLSQRWASSSTNGDSEDQVQEEE